MGRHMLHLPVALCIGKLSVTFSPFNAKKAISYVATGF